MNTEKMDFKTIYKVELGVSFKSENLFTIDSKLNFKSQFVTLLK